MGVYEQLNEADQQAVQQLARYLIETEGNRFYQQEIEAVRNHLAGNDQLVQEARRFQNKLAQMQHETDLLANTIEARAQRAAAADPVKDMMNRFMDPASRKAFSAKIEDMLKARAAGKH